MDNSLIFVAALIAISVLWITAVVIRRRREERERLAELAAKHSALMSKYNDPRIVAAIMEGKIWQGMSQQQLVDSRGLPEGKDQQVYKTKVKETWKYGQTGRNRFKERVYLENGVIVGWKD